MPMPAMSHRRSLGWALVKKGGPGRNGLLGSPGAWADQILMRKEL